MMLLRPLSLLYRLASETASAVARANPAGRTRVPARVISVGNITAGGTGKTTVTCFLAGYFRDRGRRVAVVGHGVGGTRRSMVVSDGRGNILAAAGRAGDEAVLLARNLPGVIILAGRRREQLARLAVRAFRADTVILDDAFHRLKLYRNTDIVVFNCRARLGNGLLLPAGPLREHPRNLRRADILWLNHADALAPPELERFRRELVKYNRRARFVESFYRYRHFLTPAGRPVPVEALRGKRVRIVAGIGDPETFARKVGELGAVITGTHFFPDHHFYRESEIGAIPAGGADFLVTTEKDFVRFPGTAPALPLLYPKIELVVKGFEPC